MFNRGNAGRARSVKVEGAHLWGRTQKKLLPVYQIAGLDPELIQESRENLISHFQSKGYFDVAVSPMFSPHQTARQFFFASLKGRATK